MISEIVVDTRSTEPIQRIIVFPLVCIPVSQGPLAGSLDGERKSAITDYAEANNLSASEALEEVVDMGLTASTREPQSAVGEEELTPAQLESQQQTIVRQQRQIVRFQKVTVFGGLGWAILTFATGANGPVWTAIGMGIIVLMAASTYAWEYVPGFE
ncbi:MAG: hypothetical protein J07HN4v3_01726 [Halonotius sp. J07HN4]|nr:MAG: hypothetical protein J07HN4v3_01726 [Halonotius sp. J07HN4]